MTSLMEVSEEGEFQSVETSPYSADYFPPINFTPCSLSTTRYEGQTTSYLAAKSNDEGSSDTRFVVSRRLLQKGRSPVYATKIARGQTIQSASITKEETALKSYPASVLLHTGCPGSENALKEMKALAFLRGQHPNIIDTIAFYEQPQANLFFLEMPLISGGDGITIIEHYFRTEGKAYFPMSFAKQCIRDLLSALEYLHSKGITHHDISPEQLLYDPNHKRFVLIDFGMCIRQAWDSSSETFLPYQLTHNCGKETYWAPEVHFRAPGPIQNPTARDMWSVGPTTAMILTGHSLRRTVTETCGYSISDYFQRTRHCVFEAMRGLADSRGEDYIRATEFIVGLMQHNPDSRPTATAALEDPWLDT